MKKTLLVPLIVLAIAIAAPAFAIGGVGQIRINPALPTMLTSPATFSVNVTTGTSYDPHLLLVMTDDCYTGMTGDIMVTWAGGSVTFAKAGFTSDNTASDTVPSGTVSGADYTVASLKSHLNTGDQIWWACKPFLAGPITTTPTSFTITITSTHTKMLVYALGMSTDDGTLLDMKTPNTIPGFVVPEPAAILMALGSFAAFGIYAVKRKKK